MDPLDRFSRPTREWFAAAFHTPTAAQAGAWDAIGRQQHALVVAPTGSGKTLAAFLWALDSLAWTPPPDEPQKRCRVLYISPIKALAYDVDRNLRAPLAGMRAAAQRLGMPEPDITIGMRTGDTAADERRRLSRTPPDVLITTPESLFLLLTSAARESLRGVTTVVVDEVHAVAGTKRGAHLALSLERLDVLLEKPAQRIGLSATVRPVAEIAAFLGGAAPVQVVQPPSSKVIEVEVVVPVADLTKIGEGLGGASSGPAGLAAGGSAAGAAQSASLWPAVEARILDLVEAHRSTIVFANSRRSAERLCSHLNELAAERAGEPKGEIGQPAASPAQSGAGHPGHEIARAHHGSVSREQRLLIEEELKAGRLPAVVATSSLELGVDMGAVDLVIQVEAPPSVASGLQRIGRAGHQVGAVSRGVVFPKFRGDLVPCAVVAERMRSGSIESLRYPRNPLDVLAQQIVAILSEADITVDDLAALIRRAAPFAGLPQSALEATLDMLAGRYPSDDFAELRPRIVWDRITGVLSARPGAQRLAVTSGGTIPDRGMFGVFLVGEKPNRVGELDEEMVYESRVGDVFLLGSSSWRIEDITHDRVLVTPAPGQPGRMPYWHGDSLGRPLELGRAIGAFLREVGSSTAAQARARCTAAGLDEWATDNVLLYLGDQREATGHIPDDRTLLVERFRDELGDWRLVLHSPFGAQVNGPWALAVAARARERYGIEVQTMHSDDGIVLRLPETFSLEAGSDTPPTAEMVLLGSDEVEAVVTNEVGGSAVFASRFRECAGRALLLPRRSPGKRTPLWQQRQRSAQLLQVASKYGSFPIVLEAMREVLQDVYDVPGLVELLRDVEQRRVRVVEVETQQPSPFARTLLFGYVGAFMYDGDSPLAERRAQALSLDTSLLAELLGRAELRELVDPEALAEVEAEVSLTAEDRHAKDAEGAADVLRRVGDLTSDEALLRGVTKDWLEQLEAARRVVRVRIAGEERWLAVEDVGRVRDALGTATPVGVASAFLEPVADPLADLVSRYARTHGPFQPPEVAERFGLGVAVVEGVLARLTGSGRLVTGEFRPSGSGTEWCDAEVLRRIRRRSLARSRAEVEPVPAATLGVFLPAWQGVGPTAARGLEALLRAVDQLAGVPIPASALESLVLPARVRDYQPSMLDELCSSGEVLWSGAGSLPGDDGWVVLAPADAADLLLAPPQPVEGAAPLLEALDGGGALFFRALATRLETTDSELTRLLWDLVWAGHITNDTLAPLRALIAGGKTAHKAPATNRARPGRYARPGATVRISAPATTAGRWSRLPEVVTDPTRRAHALADLLLDRYGVVLRGAVAAEQVPGGFGGVYKVLSAFEDSGRCRRGYFVEGLGAAQFASPGAVDRLRVMAKEQAPAPDEGFSDPLWSTPVPGGWDAWASDGRGRAKSPKATDGTLVLAATDPANPYGAAIPWPERPGEGRPARKAGAIVVLLRGDPVLWVERGGRTLLTWTDDPTALGAAVAALAQTVTAGRIGSLTVTKADGDGVLDSALGAALETAGFVATPQGLRLRR